jgi:hypothetical protein
VTEETRAGAMTKIAGATIAEIEEAAAEAETDGGETGATAGTGVATEPGVRAGHTGAGAVI